MSVERFDIETPLSLATLNVAPPTARRELSRATAHLAAALGLLKIGGQSIMDRGGDADAATCRRKWPSALRRIRS